MISGIRHIGVVTAIRDTSVNFYKTLGFKKVLEQYEECSLYSQIIQTIKMKHEASQLLLELIYYPGADMLRTENYTERRLVHIAVTVPSVQNVEEHLKERFKSSVEFEVTPYKDNVHFITSPEGLLIELVEEKC